MKQFADTMNTVLEGERTDRRILKLGWGEISEEESARLEREGVHYDPVEGVIWYIPNVSVLAASRPLDNRYFTYLNKSGYFDRHHVIQHRITRKEAIEHLHRDFRLDQDALSQLREANLKLSEVKPSRTVRPSEVFMKPIYDDLEMLVDDEIAERKQEFSEVVSPRLKGDIIREFAAHAFLRTASQNGFHAIDELQYAQEDVDFVKDRLFHFVDFVTNPLIAEEFTNISKKGTKKDLAKESILASLADRELKRGPNIVDSTVSKVGCNNATVYSSLRELKTEGRLCKPNYSFYKLKEDCTKCSFNETCAAIDKSMHSGGDIHD